MNSVSKARTAGRHCNDAQHSTAGTRQIPSVAGVGFVRQEAAGTSLAIRDTPERVPASARAPNSLTKRESPRLLIQKSVESSIARKLSVNTFVLQRLSIQLGLNLGSNADELPP